MKLTIERFTIDNISLSYIEHSRDAGNEAIENCEIIECKNLWEMEKLEKWLVGYSYDMFEVVMTWLNDHAAISEGLYLKIVFEGE